MFFSQITLVIDCLLNYTITFIVGVDLLGPISSSANIAKKEIRELNAKPDLAMATSLILF